MVSQPIQLYNTGAYLRYKDIERKRVVIRRLLKETK